jgi:putative acetyltransferase
MTATVVTLPKLLIAPLEAADVERAAELVHRVWHDTYRAALPPKLRSPRTVAYWSGYLADRCEHSWMATVGSRPAGVVSVSSNCVDDLWVARRYRGRGVGRRLLDEALADLAQRGFEAAQAGCEDFNESAVGFFHHLGWTVIGNEPLLGLVPGRQVEALVFSRRLKGAGVHGRPEIQARHP